MDDAMVRLEVSQLERLPSVVRLEHLKNILDALVRLEVLQPERSPSVVRLVQLANMDDALLDILQGGIEFSKQFTCFPNTLL